VPRHRAALTTSLSGEHAPGTPSDNEWARGAFTRVCGIEPMRFGIARLFDGAALAWCFGCADLLAAAVEP